MCIFRERVAGRQVLELRGGIWGSAVWLGWLELRALNLAAMIDYFSNFWAIFGDAQTIFRGGRQDSDILLGFCLLLLPRGPISVGSVDKFQAFCSVFVYFRYRAYRFRSGRRQDSSILLGFCLLLPPCAPISVGSVDKFQAFCSVFVYFCLRAGRDAQWQPVSAYFYGQTFPNP